MRDSDAIQRQAHSIEFGDFVVEGTSRIEVPRIIEQLKKISELKLDNITQLTGAKFESTVKEMFSIIKELEGHLRDVLALNAALRSEVQVSRREKEGLQSEKEMLERKVASLECDIPRISDLEKRMDIALEEIEKFRKLYKLAKEKAETYEANELMLAAKLDKVKEERDDAYREIVVLEDKIKSMTRSKE